MYCQKSDDTRSNCDYCAPITRRRLSRHPGLHALPPEKQQAVKTLLNIKPKKTAAPT